MIKSPFFGEFGMFDRKAVDRHSSGRTNFASLAYGLLKEG